MKKFALVTAALLISLACYRSLRATIAPPQNSGAAWSALADDFFDNVYFKFSPSLGTGAGFHQYDTQLEDYSHAGVLNQIAALHAIEKRVETFDDTTLSPSEQADRELVLSNIRGTLLTLETIRPWQKNPDTYSSGISESVFGIMSRKFASPDARLASVVAREKQMPAVFVAARANLKNPPHIYTEIAIQQLPDIISFFQKDVPLAFAAAYDPAVKADFAKSNAAVIAELQSYQKWLQTDVLPKSKGDFRIGPATFSPKTSVRRNGGHAARPPARNRHAPIFTITRTSLSAIAKEVDRDETAACKSWPSWKAIIPRRTICCRLSATLSTA